MKLDQIEPFHVADQKGLLRRGHELPADAVVIFVSHQWLSVAHPDPDGYQLKTLQARFKSITNQNLSEIFRDETWEKFCQHAPKNGIQEHKLQESPDRKRFIE